jgi:hypothetical protein
LLSNNGSGHRFAHSCDETTWKKIAPTATNVDPEELR